MLPCLLQILKFSLQLLLLLWVKMLLEEPRLSSGSNLVMLGLHVPANFGMKMIVDVHSK
jgi:hypothetical protein